MGSRSIAAVCVAWLLAAVGSATAQGSPPRLAVLVVATGEMQRETADSLTEVLIAALVAGGGVEVVGKEEFQAQLGTDERESLDCVSSTPCLGRVGVELEVDEVIAGTVGPRRDGGYTLSLNRIDIATLRVQGHVFKTVEGGERELVAAVQRSADELRGTDLPGEPVDPESPASPRHSGFYLRGAIGGGRLEDTFEGASGLVRDGSATGASVAFELSAGGAVAPGLILGGGLLVESVQDPEVEIDGASATHTRFGALVALVAFVDWYLNPDKGFHLQGGLGGGRMAVRDEDDPVLDHDPAGGLLMLGVGYEWWVGDEWALGVLGRFVGCSLRDESIEHSVTAASVMFSTTYN